MIPAARTFTRSPGLAGSVAVTASAVPLLFFLPGFEERLAAQAAKWGPRWNSSFQKINQHPRMERAVARIEPKIESGVKKVEPPLKRAAIAVDKRIKWVLEKRK